MLSAMDKVPGFDSAADAGKAISEAGDKALGLASNINKIPNKKNVTFYTNAAAVAKTIAAMNRESAKAGGSRIHYSSGYGGGQTAYAKGTNYAAGGIALVGEEGPELAYIPRGSTVKTASETRAILGRAHTGGDTYNFAFNVAGFVGNDAQLATEFERVLIKHQRAKGTPLGFRSI